MITRLLFSLFLLIFIPLHAKPPQLTSRDARVKIEEILKSHVSHQKLTPELFARALTNYIDELDPSKSYFIESDITIWLNPSQELLSKSLQDYKNEEFGVFEEIHKTMLLAIDRRIRLESAPQTLPPPEKVHFSEFKEMKWVQTEDELTNRLLRMKTLQLETAEKLDGDNKEQFMQRLAKRRKHRESELVCTSVADRKKMVLALVLKAMSSALDSQTAYFTPMEANQFLMQVQQRLFGIGAQLKDDLTGLTVMRLLDGGPARLSGKIKEGDRIIAVDSEPIVGMDISEAVELIRGQEGTLVTLTILREDKTLKTEEKLEIEIVRSEVVLNETRLESAQEPFGDGTIGVFHLFSFYQDSNTSSAEDLFDAIEKMKKEQNLKGVVLDLRNNAGGILQQAVAVTGLFIKKGIVVSVKDNTGEVQHLRNIDGKRIWTGPLIVLTSKASASAAEIVAQTLQDYGRALVVGDEYTYGKGTFQTFTLEAAKYTKVNPKGEYKVTRGRYYTVSGKSPQLTGVRADVVVPGPFSKMEIGEKFAKFPLENEHIPSHFEDDLADVPAMHRAQVTRLYKFDLQQIEATYTPHLALLRKNSDERVSQNKNYQTFLKSLKADEESDDEASFGQTDLQLEEAINVTKDLILLTDQTPAQKTAA